MFGRWAQALLAAHWLKRAVHAIEYRTILAAFPGKSMEIEIPSRLFHPHIRPFIPPWHFDTTQHPISRLAVFLVTPARSTIFSQVRKSNSLTDCEEKKGMVQEVPYVILNPLHGVALCPS